MKIIEVPFHGHTLLACGSTEDDVLVPLRPICDKIGIDIENQRKKVRSREAFGAVMFTAPELAVAMKTTRPVLCLPRKALAFWLASITPGKVKPELRPMLIAYQREAADVLDRYFRTGEAIPARRSRRVEAVVEPADLSDPPMPKLSTSNPMRQAPGFQTADYIEYLQLKAWALDLENRRLKRELGHG